MVADYDLEEKSELLIYKGNINCQDEYIPNEEELQIGYSCIREMFGENLYFGEDVMKEAIIKYKGNIKDVRLYLNDETNVENLQKEIEYKKCKLEQKMFCIY